MSSGAKKALTAFAAVVTLGVIVGKLPKKAEALAALATLAAIVL